MIPSARASTAACASSIGPTWGHTVMPRRGASWTSGQRLAPDTRSALPRRSSRVEPPDHCLYTGIYLQALRSASQVLQCRECNGTTVETEVPLEFVDTQALVLAFPLQHTEGHETTGD